MGMTLVVHIVAGSLGLLSGYVALSVAKGSDLHRKVGLVFVYVMVAMTATGLTIALTRDVAPKINVPIALLTGYLVLTGLTTMRPPFPGSEWLGFTAMLVAIGVSVADLSFAVEALGATGNARAMATPYFIFGTVALLASVGDFRVMRSGPLRGKRRLARHLWRMCFALAIASLSFFIGQSQVFPEPIRIMPLLALPLLAVLVTMFYWLWRVRTLSPSTSAMPYLRRFITGLVLAVFALSSTASAQSLDRARELFETARYAEAKTELLALQKADDRNPAVAYYLGRIATIQNESDDAIKYFERAVKIEEGNALYHLWLGNAIREVTPRSSKIRMPFNARRMKKEWERAVALDPNLIDARYGLVQFYGYAPGVMGGDITKAREQVAEIAKRNAMRGAIARGILADIEKNSAAEEAAYRDAIAAAPDSAAGYFALGGMYARAGKATEAFATLDQYAKRRPDDRHALYEVGRFAGTTGQQLDRGEAALKQYLATPPADVDVAHTAGAHYWLGQVAEKRGLKDAARDHYRVALKINPNSQLSERALRALK
jgi:tetratricopeptide (TPR) repeat protein